LRSGESAVSPPRASGRCLGRRRGPHRRAPVRRREARVGPWPGCSGSQARRSAVFSTSGSRACAAFRWSGDARRGVVRGRGVPRADRTRAH